MSYLLFKNPGEMDIRGLTHTGMSSKRDQDDQIGKYGSGWKHALARLLREDVGIRIFVGVTPVTVGKREIDFRGTKHDEVLLNRKPAGFTTGMGLDWELWMALREIYCNAIDERGGIDTITEKPEGVAGETRVYVQMTKEIREIYDQWDRYFAFDREKKADFGDKAIYMPIAPGLTVYRRGVRVFYSEHKKALWDYEFRGIGINESRVIKSEWDITWNMATLLKSQASRDMVHTLLWADRESMEWKMDWSNGCDTMSPEWISYLDGYTVIPAEYAGHFLEEAMGKHIHCPSSFCKWAHDYSQGKIKVAGAGKRPDEIRKPMEQTMRHKTLLADAIGFLKFGGFTDIDRFPIVVAEMDAKVLGEFKDGTVYLSNQCFDHGRRCVVETLLEEYGHAKSNASDETREFQNVLLRFCVTAIEERTGKFL